MSAKTPTIHLRGGTGLAVHPYELLAFDRALRDAGVADLNHVRVSSIIPPYTQILRELLPDTFTYGKLAYTVYSKIAGQSGETITACLALVRSTREDGRGVIFEVALKGTQAEAERMALNMALDALNDRRMVPSEKREVCSASLTVPDGMVGCAVVTAIMDFA